MNQKTGQTDKPFPRWFAHVDTNLVRRYDNATDFGVRLPSGVQTGNRLAQAEWLTYEKVWRELTQSEAEAILKK